MLNVLKTQSYKKKIKETKKEFKLSYKKTKVSNCTVNFLKIINKKT